MEKCAIELSGNTKAQYRVQADIAAQIHGKVCIISVAKPPYCV